MPRIRLGRFAPAAGLVLAFTQPVLAQGPVHTPRVHALTKVRIVQAPGRVIPQGTVVVRDGVIEAVGASVKIPADARIWELDSLTVYAGLIDLAMDVSPPEEAEEKPKDLRHSLEVVRPEYRASDALTLKDTDRNSRRGQGILTARVLPDKGVFRGEAALLNMGDGGLSANLLKASCGQVVSFATVGGGREEYPASTMGAVATIRQTFYDVRWYDQAQAVYAASPSGKERPEASAAFAALSPALAGDEALIFVTADVLGLLRAGEMAKEFGVMFEYVGSGDEYKRIDEVRAFTKDLVAPVNFPEAPSVGDPGSELNVATSELRHWENAPKNPQKLHEAGVRFALTARGLKDAGSFRKNVRKAIESGLSADVALASVTTVPATMAGVADRLGTVEAGKIANLVITDGDLFAEKTKVREVWIDGKRYEQEAVKPPEGDPRGTWEIVSETADGGKYPSMLVLSGEPGSLTGKLTMSGSTVDVDVTQSGTSVTITFDGTPIGIAGKITFTLEVKEDSASGSGESAFGPFTVTGNRTAKPTRADGTDGGSKP